MFDISIRDKSQRVYQHINSVVENQENCGNISVDRSESFSNTPLILSENNDPVMCIARRPYGFFIIQSSCYLTYNKALIMK